MDTKLIGDKIATARKQKSISQAQLAEILFISPQAVGKWERGESVPDLMTINRLAEIFGVDLNYFSNSFSSVTTQMPPSELLSHQPAVQPLENKSQKLNWNMSDGKWVDADFSGLKDLHEKFNSSHLQRCKFIGSDLSGLSLKSNHVKDCDFSDSNLSNSRIHSSHLDSNIFENSLLSGSEFLECDVKSCNFSGADFTGLVSKASAFRKNILQKAIWKHVSFNLTHFADVIFDSTIENCLFENCAFINVVFQNMALHNTFFKCKKLKGIRFDNCKADRITYEFLKNGKADLSGISLL